MAWRRSPSAQMSNLPPDYGKQQTSPLASLKAQWPAEQACRKARHFAPLTQARECVSMALGPGNLVCAHGTTILTNREPSELVEECVFYAPTGYDTDYIRKLSL